MAKIAKVAENLKSCRKVAEQVVAKPSKGHTYTNPRHVHSQITRAVTAMDGCLAIIWAHQHSIDIHGCDRPGDMAVRMREALARPWVGVCVPFS